MGLEQRHLLRFLCRVKTAESPDSARSDAIGAFLVAPAIRMELNETLFARYSISKGEFMKIDIERLGLTNVTVDPETLFSFPEGIAGFEECKRFKLFHEEGKSTVFWLQSVDDTTVMFPIVAPEALDIEYQIELSDADCTLIGSQDAADVAVVVIVYRNEAEGGKIAANTRSPVILNLKTRKGMQKVLQDVHPTLLYRAR